MQVNVFLGKYDLFLLVILPPPLRQGDVVAFVAPSAGLAPYFRHRVERAAQWFRSMGFEVAFSKNFWKGGYIAGTPGERAEDINEMIDNPDVKAMIPLIGGDHSIQLVDLIDYKAFRRNPKIFSGFSDITVLHLAFYKKSRVVTFYGPMVLTQFGEYPRPYQYTVDYFFRAVRDGIIGAVRPTKYTDQFLDWKEYDSVPRTEWKDTEFVWLREGSARGKLLGGCLPSILRVAGTKYFPSFHDAILFIETPEGEEPGTPYPLERVDADLSQLIQMGVFEYVNGVIFGIPYRYDRSMKNRFFELVLKRLAPYDFPVLAEVNFGHIDPIITIPYGVDALINSEKNAFRIMGRSVLGE